MDSETVAKDKYEVSSTIKLLKAQEIHNEDISMTNQPKL
jgi:hypothetical protein